MAFWITSPLTDPSPFIMTAGIFDATFAFERVLAVVALGLLAGWLTWQAERRGVLGPPPLRRRLACACDASMPHAVSGPRPTSSCVGPIPAAPLPARTAQIARPAWGEWWGEA